jgi:predicted nucleotidyltransferase
MKTKIEYILEKAGRMFKDFNKDFVECYEKSSQVVIFGSFVYGCENSRSDIDILFVGEGRRKARKGLDFIWLKPQRIYSRSWLGSELATHISAYGLWAKGDNEWKDLVFFSKAAITRKKEKIYNRLLHIFLKKDNLSLQSKYELTQQVLLNCHRLKMLYNDVPIPPTAISAQLIMREHDNLLTEMFSDKFLGRVAEIFLKEIFPDTDINMLYEHLKSRLYSQYPIQLYKYPHKLIRSIGRSEGMAKKTI